MSDASKDNAQRCLDRLRVELLGKDWYLVDPVSGALANAIVTEKIIRRFKPVPLKERVCNLLKVCNKAGDPRLKPILDVACGAKMFWFDKNNPNVEFCDNRIVPYHEYYPKRYIEIKPDTVCDFTELPFPDKTFKLVVFDPPHLTWAGPKSWIRLKYGCLDERWPQMIHDGFAECMRVLDDYGTLIFKWSEVEIPLKKVLKAIGHEHEPLFGHRSGKNMNTHWLCFMRFPKRTDC